MLYEKLKIKSGYGGWGSGWDSFLLKYGGEVSVERQSIFCLINISSL